MRAKDGRDVVVCEIDPLKGWKRSWNGFRVMPMELAAPGETSSSRLRNSRSYASSIRRDENGAMSPTAAISTSSSIFRR